MQSVDINGKKYILAEQEGMINITSQSKKEIERLEASFCTDIVPCLAEANAVLAGGALTSLFTNKEVNDYDIYFKNVEGFQSIINDIYDTPESGSVLSSYDVIVNFATDRSILCKEKWSENAIQFIVYKMFPDIQDIFNAFDFTVNMCAYDFATQQMWAHPDFLKHCSQRYLSFNGRTDYPVVSALRVMKYTERGYTISKAEMLRILFTIAAKEYKDWQSVKEEVGSMYGIPVDKLFDETKEFNLEEVVLQLNNCVALDKPRVMAEAYDTKDLATKFPHLLDQKWAENNNFWWAKEAYGQEQVHL
ncbi:MAG: hypothetical protein M0R77_07685 [Gammaproteobacteria bacterium]|nr:hypothetical protein [Gammaproteobacteria bacterium]